jgi:nucleolar protein 9
MKSMFTTDAKDTEVKSIPVQKFSKMACRFVKTIRKELGENEVRALAANQVASPVLQVSYHFFWL